MSYFKEQFKFKKERRIKTEEIFLWKKIKYFLKNILALRFLIRALESFWPKIPKIET